MEESGRIAYSTNYLSNAYKHKPETVNRIKERFPKAKKSNFDLMVISPKDYLMSTKKQVSQIIVNIQKELCYINMKPKYMRLYNNERLTYIQGCNNTHEVYVECYSTDGKINKIAVNCNKSSPETFKALYLASPSSVELVVSDIAKEELSSTMKEKMLISSFSEYQRDASLKTREGMSDMFISHWRKDNEENRFMSFILSGVSKRSLYKGIPVTKEYYDQFVVKMQSYYRAVSLIKSSDVYRLSLQLKKQNSTK
jgi:hypothetical protein